MAAFSAFPAIVSAQPVLVGATGDPNLDVSAVQAAVDKGAEVVLKGHFSFNRPATAPAGEETDMSGGCHEKVKGT
jgi:hypothetical protein